MGSLAPNSCGYIGGHGPHGMDSAGSIPQKVNKRKGNESTRGLLTYNAKEHIKNKK